MRSLQSSASAVAENERLIIDYQTQLDGNTQFGASLTNVAGAVDWAGAATVVSLMNREKRKPSDIHRPFGTLPGYFSIDGPVDEIKLYDQVLSANQIAAAARPTRTLPSPALPLRQMPV